MARKRPGPYVPLSVYYADDEAIMDAGEDAELMFTRMMAYAGRTPTTEGWISRRVCLTRMGIMERPELGPELGPESAPERRLERLLNVGLISAVGDGYQLNSWLRWNRSAEEMGLERQQDRKRKAALTREYPETGPESYPETGPETGPDSAPVPDGRSRSRSKEETSSEVADAPSDREDVEALCEQLATRIEDNGSKRPTITKAWRDSARLMLDRDDRAYADVQALIDWCQYDNFWRTNILSMPKFRDQYDKLRLRAGSTDGQATQTHGQVRTIDGKVHGPGERPGPWTPLAAPAPGQTTRDQYHDHWREIGWDHERECWIEAAS